MKQDVVIRPASRDDFDQLITLFESVADERLWIGTEPGFDQRAYRAGWADVVDGKGGALFVAAEGDCLVGTLGIRHSSNHGCELGMLVKMSHRGRGVGSALVTEAIQWARQRGEPSLSLLVFPHNAAAIALYKRFGFEERRRYERFKKRQNGDVWDVILMVRPLAGRRDDNQEAAAH